MMRAHTFRLWLQSEIEAAQHALLTLYEQRDALLYIDGPRLEQAYLETFSAHEETVIREEIECELLEKKQQLLRAALNRREPIDETAIDAALDAERQKILADAADTEAPAPFAALSEEQEAQLRTHYGNIVHGFHPELHPELTETHRELFQRALEAYRRKDLDALKLISEMLSPPANDAPEVVLLPKSAFAPEVLAEASAAMREPEYGTDYAIAAQIYGCFRKTAEEAIIQEALEKYRALSDTVMREIEALRATFPYNTEGLLSDPTRIQAYEEELRHRLHAASTERARRIKEIQALTKEGAAHV